MPIPDEAIAERRVKPRVYLPYIVKVRGEDAAGKAFEAHTIAHNLSASGLYLQMGRCVKKGARLLIVLNWRWADEPCELRIALRGLVVRTETCSDGLCGFAVKFTRSRFLYGQV